MSARNKTEVVTTTNTHSAMHGEPQPAAPQPAAIEFAQDYHAVERELHALPDTQLAVFNVDVPTAVSLVRAAMPRLATLHPLLAELPRFDLAGVEKLPQYAGALWYTHARCLTTSSEQKLPELAKACGDRFDALLIHAQSLCKAGLLPPETLRTLGTLKGYKPTAMDTSALVEALRTAWPKVVGHTAVTVADLDDASRAARELIDGLQGRDSIDRDAMALRQRAFTLFARAYDEARRGVSFVRWHEDDVADFVPPLHTGRKAHHDDAPAEGQPATPAAPAAPNAAMRAMSGDPASTPDLASAMPKSPFINK